MKAKLRPESPSLLPSLLPGLAGGTLHLWDRGLGCECGVKLLMSSTSTHPHPLPPLRLSGVGGPCSVPADAHPTQLQFGTHGPANCRVKIFGEELFLNAACMHFSSISVL